MDSGCSPLQGIRGLSALTIVLALVGPSILPGQPLLFAEPPKAAEVPQADAPITVFPIDGAALAVPSKAVGALTNKESTAIDVAIESLSSPVFAVREQSAEALLAMGQKVVPRLRKRCEVTIDPEVRLRSRALIKQLQDGDFEEKVSAFLSGQEVDLEGWQVFRIMFGENDRSRDIFVQLLREYPQLVSSFHGTARDRALAMDDVLKAVREKLSKPTLRISVADGVAMLLPVSDEAVPLTSLYERQMMLILRLNPVSTAQKDPKVGTAFKGLLNAWVRRSTIANRIGVMSFAMQRDLHTVYPLAQKTLTESNDPQQLAFSMQAIARFGVKEDKRLIAGFLDDDRTLTTILYQRGEQTRTRLGDAAMATIAILHDVPLTELGFPASAEHEKLGFIYEELLFKDIKRPTAAARKEAKAKVYQLMGNGELKPSEKQKS